MPARDIGIQVPAPQQDCTDEKCPFHGSLRVRGQIVQGRVATARMQNTVVVTRDFFRYVAKFERYEKRRSKYSAHNPPCINAAEGDEVTIMECRPISKTKHFVVVAAKRGRALVKGQDYSIEPGAARPGRSPKAAPAAAPGGDEE